MHCNEVLNKIADKYKRILGNNLVGIYVHGSLAFGCFNPNRSDIDFIVVVDSPPALEQKEELIKTLIALSSEAPAKGFEMSVVLSRYCINFVYPTPFELHYSIMHLKGFQDNLREYCKLMTGTDKDLAAHFTVIKSIGYPIIGKEVSEVFGNIPRMDYLDSIQGDIENAMDNILDNPVYTILNLCRVLAYKNKGLILSKEQGGLWGIERLPKEYKSLISKALRNYTSEADEAFKEEVSLSFCSYMLKNI